MENLTDTELLERIRHSDEKAFYAFCHRHWKSQYIQELKKTGCKDMAFEQVKDAFIKLWDRRRHLPNMATAVASYLFDERFHEAETERG